MANVTLSIADPDLDAMARAVLQAAGNALTTPTAAEVVVGDRHALELAQHRPLVIVARTLDDADAMQTMWRIGIADYVILPSEGERLPFAVRRAAEHAAVLREMRTLRNRLLALLIHDLRNPLGVIKVNLDLLVQTKSPLPPEDQVEVMGEIKQANDRALQTLQDLVDIQRAEDTGLALAVMPLRVRRFVESCIDRQRPSAQTRDVKLATDFAMDGTSNLDAEHLGRAINHVLVNSIRYAPRRGEVKIGTEAPTDAPDRILLYIENNGPNLPPDAQRRIFDRYGVMAIDDGKRHPAYRGLGLYLARIVVETHGGTIRCVDRVGGGVRFELTLPVASNLAAE